MLLYLILDRSPGGTPVPLICTENPLQMNRAFKQLLDGEIETQTCEVVVYQIPLNQLCLPHELNTRTGPDTFGPFKQIARACRTEVGADWQVTRLFNLT